MDAGGSRLRDASPPALSPKRSGYRLWPVAIGLAALAVPTAVTVAQRSWSGEQGALGPILLAIAVWLVVRRWPRAAAEARLGSLWLAVPVLLVALLVHGFARATQTSVLMDAYSLWLILVAVAYAFVGSAALRRLWFPLGYMLFAVPPPDFALVRLTRPLRLWLSEASVWLFDLLGYPVAYVGVTIHIDRYELLVKDACSGLSSIISLAAVGLFYAYVRYDADWRYCVYFTLVMAVVAIAANFVRVLLLMAITYHFGDAAAQGFLHGLAGMTLFTLAVGGMFLADHLSRGVRRALGVSM